MEDKNKKGSYKKKGAAEESDAQQAKNLVDDMEGGIKNAGDNEKSAKELKAEGKKLKQQARDKKKADRKSARATKRSDRKTNKSKKLQDKIDLQTLKGEQKSKAGKTISAQAKKDRVKKLQAKKDKIDGVAKKDVMMDEKMSDAPPRKKGSARMGFTQNFGPARQNSYAQGAARVASIMSFGASKKKGAADEQEKKHVHAPTLGSSNLSLNSNIKPSSSMPDFSASLNQEVQKAPTLTGNSYKGHSSVSDIVSSQSSNRDFSSPSAMNLKDNQISRNSQFHYDTGDTSKLTPEKNQQYNKFLGEGTYISSKDMQKTNKNVNLNNPIYNSNKKAQTAFSEGRVYNNKYGF